MTTTVAVEGAVPEEAEGHLSGRIAAARAGDRASLEALRETIERRAADLRLASVGRAGDGGVDRGLVAGTRN